MRRAGPRPVGLDGGEDAGREVWYGHGLNPHGTRDPLGTGKPGPTVRAIGHVLINFAATEHGFAVEASGERQPNIVASHDR